MTRRPRPARGRTRLKVADIDAARALSAWLARRRPIFARIALRGTWLDKDDVARLRRLSLPGLDEIAALLEITRRARSGRYDVVVVDTAPTGHTLRMLQMPDVLRAIARVFDHMQAKHRVMAEALRGEWEPDEADDLIEELDRDGRELTQLLRDPSRARMSWVTLPEELAVAETLDALGTLSDAGIPVTRLIVNRVTPPPLSACRWCQARRVVEGKALAPLRRAHPRLPATAVAARSVEPRGARALTAVARDIGQPPELPSATGRLARVEAVGVVHTGATRARDPLRAIDVPGVQLLMFGGKGGVGKTTCAAAAALAIADRHRQRRVLLLSTDPAHSLHDVFAQRMSAPNLCVRELDATQTFEQVRVRYGEAIDAMFDRFSRESSFDATHDRRVMRDLIDLAPPGIDEIAAVLEVTDALTDAPGDLLVVDTAPTGHALRLLQMPAIVQDWTKAVMSILLKYQPVVGLGDLGSTLLRLSQGTRRLRQLLADSRRTRFVAVTRAAALPREETVRMIGELRTLGIVVPVTIVNAAGAGTCAHCARMIRAERAELERLDRGLRGTATRVVVSPGEMPPPRGVSALQAWVHRWTAL